MQAGTHTQVCSSSLVTEATPKYLPLLHWKPEILHPAIEQVVR